jgi:transcriptional regulator with XRE-family HTH domain
MTIREPSTQARPALRAYRNRLRLTRAEVGEAIGVSEIQIGRYELPFASPRRQIPREEVLRRFHEWSGGALTPADFYAPDLAREPGSPAAAQ